MLSFYQRSCAAFFRRDSNIVRFVRSSVSIRRQCSVPGLYQPVKMSEEQRLIWMDLEMTGLDVATEQIMEVGCVVTDEQLQPIGTGVNIIVHQSKETLDKMDDWCTKHHGKSGLTDESLKSTVSVEEAETQVLDYVRKHTALGASPLAGNTIYMDRKFIEKFMPNLHRHFHYRIVDVSTVKELCRRWFPVEFENAPKKRFSHRSIDDIHDSIAELLYYRKAIFKGENDIGDRPHKLTKTL